MENLDGFKSFVRGLPSLRNDVVNGQYTWQQLYEMYVLYGENHAIWNAYRGSTTEGAISSFDFGSLLSMVKNIDLDMVSSSLDGMQKLLGIVSTMVDKPEDASSQKETASYRRYDD